MRGSPSVHHVRRHHLVPRLAAIGMALALAACGGSDTSTGPGSVAGDYSLHSVNGSPLPYTLPQTGTDAIVVDSALTSLAVNGTYVASAFGTLNGAPSTPFADAGTYTVSGSTITFTSNLLLAGATYTASATSTGFTLTVPGLLLGSGTPTLALQFVKR